MQICGTSGSDSVWANPCVGQKLNSLIFHSLSINFSGKQTCRINSENLDQCLAQYLKDRPLTINFTFFCSHTDMILAIRKKRKETRKATTHSSFPFSMHFRNGFTSNAQHNNSRLTSLHQVWWWFTALVFILFLFISLLWEKIYLDIKGQHIIMVLLKIDFL